MSYVVRSETAVQHGLRLTVEIRTKGELVPGILLLPTAAPPVAGALLIHGWTSHKEQMASSVGTALLAEGIASLALDLPMHGERESPQEMSLRNPFELVRRWRTAMSEAAAGLRILAERPEVDPDRLAVVGYSLGSFLAVMTAAGDRSVRAVVLAAGGDLPTRTPFESLLRSVADPTRAVRRLAGRPLLMVHGKWDRTVRPEQAQRLFDAAAEPKELRWYDAGHYLPPKAIAEAGAWLTRALTRASRERSGS
jgi:uncharacterized protein